jgi:hypothetical protein
MSPANRTGLAVLVLVAIVCSARPCVALSEAECAATLVTQVKAATNVDFRLPVTGQPYANDLVEPICNQQTTILGIFNETIVSQPECSPVLSAPQARFKIWPQCAARCESAFLAEWAKGIPAFVGVTASPSHNYDASLIAPVCKNNGLIVAGFDTIGAQLDCEIFARISNSRWEQKCASRCKELLKTELETAGIDVSVLFGDARWTEKGLATTCALASNITAARTKLVQGTNPECQAPLRYFLAPASHCTSYNCRSALFVSWATAFPSLGAAEDLWGLDFSAKQRDDVCAAKETALGAIASIVADKQECELGYFVKERLRIDKLDCGNCVDCLVDITEALSNEAPSDCADVSSVADQLNKCHPICSSKPEPAHKQHVETVLDLGKLPNCETTELYAAAAKFDVTVAGTGNGGDTDGDESPKDEGGFGFGDSAILIGTIAGVGGFVFGAVLLRRHTLAEDVRTLKRTMTRVATGGAKKPADVPIVVYARRPGKSVGNPNYRPKSAKNPMYSTDNL